MQLSSFLDSKSWVNPSKYVDIVVGKKKPQQNDDERLQLLPERRTRKPLKEISNEIPPTTDSTTTPGSPLFQSLSFLFDDLKLLNYSGNNDYKEQIASNSFEKAVNDLFIENEEKEELHVG